MHRQPLLIPPTSCFHCELFQDSCDVCQAHGGHCMKYHSHTHSGISPCTWRETAAAPSVQEALDLANQQLAEYYSRRHDEKQRNIRIGSSSRKRGHVRGLTRRLTITPDMFKST
jgi:hypothetical protein